MREATEAETPKRHIFGVRSPRPTTRLPSARPPSSIRTLPSAPESHRILRIRARGLYRRSGIGLS